MNGKPSVTKVDQCTESGVLGHFVRDLTMKVTRKRYRALFASLLTEACLSPVFFHKYFFHFSKVCKNMTDS